MKKYVQVGCGQRGVLSYSIPLVQQFGDCGILCGVYDINYKRAELVSELCGKEIPVFTDFDEMLETVKPDAVIVTPKDSEHDTYILKALYSGCDVISEKPLTTTFEKALAIQKAQEETKKDITVTFNLRFHPFFKRVKEIIASGVLGDILSIHYEWMLDTSHGADYFRRWHRERKNSGSLLVHKSTHHFDLANWYLDDDPVSVNAFGTRRFYGDNRRPHGKNCRTCEYAKECPYYFDIEKAEHHRQFYTNCEDVDGYLRDGCIFSDEIDIEDSVSVSIRYAKGAVMSYSLTAHSPYEGMKMMLNGTDARMEIRHFAENGKMIQDIKIYNRNGEIIHFEIPHKIEEGHGGADDQIRQRLFRNTDAPDPLGQAADLRAGLMSIGIGMAANLSMQENRQVQLSEFYKNL